MIKFDTVMSYIIDKIKTYLSDNGYAKTLLIYDNLGVAINDYKEENSDTIVSKQYGIYRNQTSQISTVSDALNMLTATAIIDLRVDAIPEKDGTFPAVSEIVGLLNDCAGQITGQYTSITENGVTYAVLPVMSPATVGDYQEDSSNWGAYVPVSVQIAFTALEGSVAPSALQLFIDGVKIPATELVLSRTKASTADVAANSLNGETTTAEESSTFEVQFACPYTSYIKSMLYSLYGSERTNTGHCVVVRDRELGADQCYLMSFAKVVMTRQNNAIVGLNANLLELSANTARLPMSDGWETRTVIVSSLDTVQETLSNGKWVIFWGDGTSQIVDASSGSVTVSHTYNIDGVCKIVYYDLGNWEG